MANHPFHFSFLVTGIEPARKFYGEVLSCPEGRSTDTWIDFDFYGNQLSLHTADSVPKAKLCGVVDTIIVPIPHFGCIIPWDEFHDLAEKLGKAGTEFIIKPTVRFVGEQTTMFFKDGCGNSLEMKAYVTPNIFSPNYKKDIVVISKGSPLVINNAGGNSSHRDYFLAKNCISNLLT